MELCREVYSAISLFAGVGGIDLGFQKTGHFKTIYANEFDINARVTYSVNFGSEHLDGSDLHDVNKNSLPKCDIVLAGFPCQAFSIAGHRKGFEDPRGDLFFETLKVIIATDPSVVFLENVKNLVSHDNGNTFKVIIESLEKNGYLVKYKILNAKEYGNVPQNRERIYIVCFKDNESYEKFDFPKPQKLTTTLSDVIDFANNNDGYYAYTNDKNKFFLELESAVTSQKTVYQWRRHYVRKNQSGMCPTLTANMGTGGHNVPIIKSNNGIRKITERECFNLQGFPSSFILPQIAKSQLYKQAGNSVVVPIIEKIAINIINALRK
jgi:DNA (cytosine-5)-methyltransferase 1